jgi:PleD family two-component response regulator
VNLPLALLFYEDLMPGTQLINRLQDLKYRVQVVSADEDILEIAASAGPMFILMDLVSKRLDTCDRIKQLRATSTTAHIPVIAFADESEDKLQSSAKEAGATLVVTDTAILPHLNQFIERALQVE